MKKVTLVMLILISSSAFAGQKDGFWDRLQTKLDKITPAKKVNAATAVGGVRGARSDDAADIYWKGRDKAPDMNHEELEKFNAAMESRSKGENELALRQFEEFLGMYPQSQFRIEGLQAVEMLKTELVAGKAVETVPEPKPAETGGSAPAALMPDQPSEAGKPLSEPQPEK